MRKSSEAADDLAVMTRPPEVAGESGSLEKRDGSILVTEVLAVHERKVQKGFLVVCEFLVEASRDGASVEKPRGSLLNMLSGN